MSNGLKPRVRPQVTEGTTEKIPLGCGRTLYVTVNRDQEGLCEVFLVTGKSGGCIASQAEAIGRLISLALRSGVDPREVVKQLKGIRCPAPTWHRGKPIRSCADAVAQALERALGESSESANQESRITIQDSPIHHSPIRHSSFDFAPECPECGGLLEQVEGCAVCRSCGYSHCG